MSFSRFLCASVLGIALFVTASPARAESLSGEAGLGLAAAVTNLIYGPVKGIYAIGGSLVAGAAWLCSGGDQEVVNPILTASLRGDYVITPEHLRRERTIEFVGRAPEDRALRQASYY